MSHANPYFISPAFAFVAYPNRDSTPFKEWYNIPEAETCVRGTLRYQGFPEFVGALVKLGWLDDRVKDWLAEGITWGEIMQRATGANDSSERFVRSFYPELFELMVCTALLSNVSKPFAVSPLNQKVPESSRACAGSGCSLRKRPHFGRATCLTHSVLDWRD